MAVKRDRNVTVTVANFVLPVGADAVVATVRPEPACQSIRASSMATRTREGRPSGPIMWESAGTIINRRVCQLLGVVADSADALPLFFTFSSVLVPAGRTSVHHNHHYSTVYTTSSTGMTGSVRSAWSIQVGQTWPQSNRYCCPILISSRC
jgi:hypothetical protein